MYISSFGILKSIWTCLHLLARFKQNNFLSVADWMRFKPTAPPKTSGLYRLGEFKGWESKRWTSQEPAIVVIPGGTTVASFFSASKPEIVIFLW